MLIAIMLDMFFNLYYFYYKLLSLLFSFNIIYQYNALMNITHKYLYITFEITSKRVKMNSIDYNLN